MCTMRIWQLSVRSRELYTVLYLLFSIAMTVVSYILHCGILLLAVDFPAEMAVEAVEGEEDE